MSLATLDLALRSATVALLLVLAASMWRDFRHVVAGRLTIALALSTIAHAVSSEIGSTAPVSLWHAPLIALSTGDAVGCGCSRARCSTIRSYRAGGMR